MIKGVTNTGRIVFYPEDYSSFARWKMLNVETYEDPKFVSVLKEAVAQVGIGKVARALCESDPSVSEVRSILSNGNVPWYYTKGCYLAYKQLYRLIPDSSVWDSVCGIDYWN